MTWYRQASRFALIVLAIALVAACSSSRRVTPAVATPPAVDAAAEGAPADAVAGYTLGPGDQVRLTVFRHTDLSGEFELDGEGTLAMPLVGEIPARGLTARQLERKIEAQLQEQGYLISPQVSIEVLNYRPFYIIGEVRSPGSYPYVNGMTVINAVALAGGYTYRAAQNDVTITRGGSGGGTDYAEPTTEVLPGDIIEVPERWF